LKIKLLTFLIYITVFLNSCSEKKPGQKETVSKAIPESSDDKVMNFTTLDDADLFSEFVEKIEQAYAKLGYKIILHKMPSLRSIQESAENDSYDGELGRIKDAEKILKNHIRIKVPIVTLKIHAAYLDDSIKVESLKDLEKYNFGYVRGSLLIEKVLKKGTGTPVKDHKQCFEMLSAGRIDVVITELRFFDGPWGDELKSRLKKSSYTLTEHKVYHFLHEKHSAIVPELTKALSQVIGQEIEK